MELVKQNKWFFVEAQGRKKQTMYYFRVGCSLFYQALAFLREKITETHIVILGNLSLGEGEGESYFTNLDFHDQWGVFGIHLLNFKIKFYCSYTPEI